MEGLRRRYVDAQEADQARNSLIEDLLQRVGDLQKQMDRHGFVLVLIDGDCMNVSINSSLQPRHIDRSLVKALGTDI